MLKKAHKYVASQNSHEFTFYNDVYDSKKNMTVVFKLWSRIKSENYIFPQSMYIKIREKSFSGDYKFQRVQWYNSKAW